MNDNDLNQGPVIAYNIKNLRYNLMVVKNTIFTAEVIHF